MAEFRRILLPTDLSELSRHAAPLARSLAERYQAELHALYVAEPAPLSSLGQDDGSYCLSINPTDAELTALLDGFLRSALPGAGVVAHVARGLPAARIIEFVREHGIDLVVMGTHAHGVVKRILLGSVSKTVLENAGCAVLLVPASAAVAEEPASGRETSSNAGREAR